MITVRHYKDLKAFKNHEEGETAFVQSEKRGYILHEGKWIPINASESGIKMNLYELNKSILSQMDPLTDDTLQYLKNDINRNLTANYYLLYGKEISYFTLFERRKVVTDMLKNETLGDMVLECLKSFEKVYSYEMKDDEGVIEIWVHNKDNNLATVLYLFDYTDGVVYYEN